MIKSYHFKVNFAKSFLPNFVTVLSFIPVSGIPAFHPRANSKLINASYEKKRSKYSKNQKQVLTLHNEMYCIINFLSFLVATSKKHNFFPFGRVCFSFFAAHELQSTALDPDYGLFIGYQMSVNKHKGLNQGWPTCGACATNGALDRGGQPAAHAPQMEHWSVSGGALQSGKIFQMKNVYKLYLAISDDHLIFGRKIEKLEIDSE